jgi:TRAP-type uncharacterized transport system substrate-binding protein
VAYLIPAPPSQITIATSPEGEHYHVLGTRYKGILADTGIKVELRLTDGAKENLRLLNDPKTRQLSISLLLQSRRHTAARGFFKRSVNFPLRPIRNF